MRTTVLVYDLDGFHTHLEFVEPADEQDYLDGASLRRLREVTPGHMVESYGPHPTTRRYLVQVVPHGWDDTGPVRRRASREGATIAEAADACREGLHA